MPMSFVALAMSALICAHPAVHDGDTIRCGRERVRLANIDAPELEGSERCTPASRRRLANSYNPAWCDPALGRRARNALAVYLAQGMVRLVPQGRDRYNRLLARVTVNGHDAGAFLINRGLAHEWRSKKPKY